MEFKKVKGFSNYKISKTGIIHSKNGDKLSPSKNNSNGYKSVVLYKNGNPHHKYIHDLVANAFLNNPNNKTIVGHKDGNKLNNNVSNLVWQSSSENTKHAYDNGLADGPNGEVNGNSKLTDKQADSIKNSNKSCGVLAKLYNIDPSTVSLIKNRKRRSEKTKKD